MDGGLGTDERVRRCILELGGMCASWSGSRDLRIDSECARALCGALEGAGFAPRWSGKRGAWFYEVFEGQPADNKTTVRVTMGSE